MCTDVFIDMVLIRMFQGLTEAPDLEFEYSDADKWTCELSGDSKHSNQLYTTVFVTQRAFQWEYTTFNQYLVILNIIKMETIFKINKYLNVLCIRCSMTLKLT